MKKSVIELSELYFRKQQTSIHVNNILHNIRLIHNNQGPRVKSNLRDEHFWLLQVNNGDKIRLHWRNICGSEVDLSSFVVALYYVRIRY